jgi:hypothetical protein
MAGLVTWERGLAGLAEKDRERLAGRPREVLPRFEGPNRAAR